MSDKDKRPTSQHLVQDANFAIRGDAKSLKQLSSSGITAQNRRKEAAAREAARVAAESSNQGGSGGQKSSPGQEK